MIYMFKICSSCNGTGELKQYSAVQGKYIPCVICNGTKGWELKEVDKHG